MINDSFTSVVVVYYSTYNNVSIVYILYLWLQYAK